MSDPSIQNVTPTDSNQVTPPIAPVAAKPVAPPVAASAATESGSGTFGTMGELKAQYPEFYAEVQKQIFLQVKRVQDGANRRIHAENKKSQ